VEIVIELEKAVQGFLESDSVCLICNATRYVAQRSEQAFFPILDLGR
jgi:hypothetical protein